MPYGATEHQKYTVSIQHNEVVSKTVRIDYTQTTERLEPEVDGGLCGAV
jgi:hypothetical protein